MISATLDRSNYALMTFDRKREAFRMVPIQRHLLFEKKKMAPEKKDFATLAAFSSQDILSESTQDPNSK